MVSTVATPTFLPLMLQRDYGRLWDRRQVQAVIDAPVRHNVAVEIDCRFRAPRFQFLMAAVVKFAFGSNSQTVGEIGNISYCVDM